MFCYFFLILNKLIYRNFKKTPAVFKHVLMPRPYKTAQGMIYFFWLKTAPAAVIMRVTRAAKKGLTTSTVFKSAS